MKKLIFCLSFAFILSNQVFSQAAPIRDKYDTLYKVIYTNYVDTGNSNIYGSVVMNNDFMLFGDSVDHYPWSYYYSYIQHFNTTTNSLTTLNYTRYNNDIGITSGVSIKTNTPNLTYAYFAPKVSDYIVDDTLVLYRYDNVSNAVSTETLQFGNGYYRHGILGMTFHSMSGPHDTLVLFNHTDYNNGDTIKIFKKHYNQTGFTFTGKKLPYSINSIKSIFKFNNKIYLGASHYSNYYLLNSTDGINFSDNTGYASSSYSNAAVTAMDTLNGTLYLVLDNGDGDYSIIKTTDGVNYTSVLAQSQGEISSLMRHKNMMFYIRKNTSYPDRPDIYYINPDQTITLSIDTLGRTSNTSFYSTLAKTNGKLYVASNYQDFSNSHFGTFIFQFLPPVANFALTSTNVCEFSPLTFVNQSTNADSVRWIKDGNYYASVSNSFVTSFTGVGQHTIGLIAIAGTQKDTLKYALNVYSISLSVTGPSSICLNSGTNFSATATGAVGQFTFSFSTTGDLTGVGGTTGNVIITGTNTGMHTYEVNGYDGNNCYANSPTYSVDVIPSKDISGFATENSLGVAGEVVLYKYEPMLTKFDSITYQTTDAAGGFTFTSVDKFDYILGITPVSNSLQVTYAPNLTGWKGSHFSHGCSSNTNKSIQVQPLTNIGTGPGVLAGKIVEGVGYGQRGNQTTVPGNPIGGLNIKVGKNPGGNIVGQSKTNASGEYTLSGLPISASGESYFLYVDIPGLDTNQTYMRVIDNTNSSYTNLDFVVDSSYIRPLNDVGVKAIRIQSDLFTFYPNPTNGVLNIEGPKEKLLEGSIILCNINGKKLKSFNTKELLLNDKLILNLNDLSNGIYILSIELNNTLFYHKVVLNK